jgi:hypothetical protein
MLVWLHAKLFGVNFEVPLLCILYKLKLGVAFLIYLPLQVKFTGTGNRYTGNRYNFTGTGYGTRILAGWQSN